MRGRGALASVASLLLVAGCSPQRPDFTVLIRNGTVFDGSGTPPQQADIGIDGDRIAAIGALPTATAGIVIDARGRLVAPGFIDLAGRNGGDLLTDGAAGRYLRQGVTTEFVVPPPGQTTGAYRSQLSRAGVSPNIGLFIAGDAMTTADAPGSLLTAEMRGGAFGVRFDAGLDPQAHPGARALADVIHRGGGTFMSAVTGDVDSASALIDFGVAAQLPEIAMTLPQMDAPSLTDLIGFSRPLLASGFYPQLVINPLLLPSTGPTAPAELKHFLAYPQMPVTTGGIEGAIQRWLALPGAGALRSMDEAIRRLTFHAAQRLMLTDRGLLRERMHADVVVVRLPDGEEARDAAAPSVDYVIVNGVVTLTPDGHTGARAGRMLLGPAYPRPGN